MSIKYIHNKTGTGYTVNGEVILPAQVVEITYDIVKNQASELYKGLFNGTLELLDETEAVIAFTSPAEQKVARREISLLINQKETDFGKNKFERDVYGKKQFKQFIVDFINSKLDFAGSDITNLKQSIIEFVDKDSNGWDIKLRNKPSGELELVKTKQGESDVVITLVDTSNLVSHLPNIEILPNVELNQVSDVDVPLANNEVLLYSGSTNKFHPVNLTNFITTTMAGTITSLNSTISTLANRVTALENKPVTFIHQLSNPATIAHAEVNLYLSAKDLSNGTIGASATPNGLADLGLDYFPMGNDQVLENIYLKASGLACDHALPNNPKVRIAIWQLDTNGRTLIQEVDITLDDATDVGAANDLDPKGNGLKGSALSQGIAIPNGEPWGLSVISIAGSDVITNGSNNIHVTIEGTKE